MDKTWLSSSWSCHNSSTDIASKFGFLFIQLSPSDDSTYNYINLVSKLSSKNLAVIGTNLRKAA